MLALAIRILASLAVIAAAVLLWHGGVEPIGHVFLAPLDVYGTTVMLGGIGLLSNVVLIFVFVIALIMIWCEP